MRLGMVELNGRLLAFGGIYNATVSNTIEEYIEEEKAWRVIDTRLLQVIKLLPNVSLQLLHVKYTDNDETCYNFNV